MGNVKGIENWICRILEFSINISNRFVQNHPFVFSVSMFFFLVYIFLPFILNFLAYTSPFIVCVAILLRIFWSSEQSYIYCFKGDGKRKNGILHRNSGSVDYDIAFNRNDYSYFQSETSRRRNVKEKNREIDEQTGKKEEESYSSKHGTFTDVSAAEDIRSLVKHSPFLSSEDLESQIRSSDGTQQACAFDVGGTRIEATNMEQADDDDEEETQEDRNSAVKWTEDDQKNLMDLGFSEIERNRRLESLIAKRRARKLYSMQVERGWGGMGSVPSSQISPIFARNNTIDLSSILNETEGLEMPDTAPSILFPKLNPFDLPYDPLEEKPNLRGDSFHQEFMATHKEPLFCRHESFSLGPSFPLEFKQDRRSKNFNPFFVSEKKGGVLEGSGYSIFKRQPRTGDRDQLMEQLLRKEDIHGTPGLVETGTEPPNQIINSVEITHEADVNTKNDTNDIKGEEEMERSHGMESLSSSDESNSLSSSEENEQNFNAYVAGVLEDVEESNPAQKSTSSLLVEPENDPFDSSPFANEMNRRGGRRMFAGQCSHHTSNCSIASDLQVEVSEVGSPPLTVDGSNSPSDGESLTYDEESEKENTFGSEEMWGASSQQSGIEENEEESRGTHEVSHGDIVGLGLSQANETSEDAVASPINPLKVDDQESTDVSSLSSSTIDISGDHQAWSTNVDPKIHDDVKQVVEGVLEPKSQFSDYLDPSSFGNLNKTMQLEFVPHSYKVHSEKPEDLSNPHKTNVVYDVNHTVDPVISNMEELKMNEDTDDGWLLLNKKEIEKPTEHQAISDSEKPTGENSKPNEDAGGNQVKLTENEIIMAMPKPIEAKEYFKSPQESGGEQRIVDSGASGITQNSDSDDPIASTAQHDQVIEEVTINSSPSPSPKCIPIQTSGVNQSYDDHIAEQQELVIQDVLINSSSSSSKSVFIENIPIDQTSSSNANQRIYVDTLRSHLEDTTKNSTLGEQPPLNLALENLESIQENGDDQSVISRGTYAVNQNDDDPVASTKLQELATEYVLINSSSSSPKPLFTANISIDQASSSNENQRIHLDILQSHLEDTTKTSTLDEQSPLNFTPENLESIQQSGDGILARGAFGMNHNYDDPNASTEQQESSIEDNVHINSSPSSPKSVLTEKTSMDQPSSNSNPNIHTDILQSQSENTEKASTLDEQPPLNLAPENLKSIQENGDEQVFIATGAPGLYHNSDDPNASVAQKEWVIAEATSNSSSSSSPKSILEEKIQIGQASSYRNQKIHMDILQSLLEDMANTNSSDKQQTLNLRPTGPQNAKYAVEDSTTCPSNNLGSENLLEPCNPPDKSTVETSTIDDLNEPKPEDKDGKENSQSYQSIKDESETWISSTGLSKPIEDNNNILGTMEPGKFIAEASTIYKVNDPIVSEKGDNDKFNSVGKSEGEFQSFIKQETVLESPEPDEPTGSKLTEDFDGNSRKCSEGEAPLCGPLKSFEEIDDSRTEEENEDSRKLHEHDTIIHLPNPGDTTCNSEESQKLTECEAVDPSKLAVEKGNPNVRATIVEEDPSDPDFPVKSIPES